MLIFSLFKTKTTGFSYVSLNLTANMMQHAWSAAGYWQHDNMSTTCCTLKCIFLCCTLAEGLDFNILLICTFLLILYAIMDVRHPVLGRSVLLWGKSSLWHEEHGVKLCDLMDFEKIYWKYHTASLCARETGCPILCLDKTDDLGEADCCVKSRPLQKERHQSLIQLDWTIQVRKCT